MVKKIVLVICTICCVIGLKIYIGIIFFNRNTQIQTATVVDIVKSENTDKKAPQVYTKLIDQNGNRYVVLSASHKRGDTVSIYQTPNLYNSSNNTPEWYFSRYTAAKKSVIGFWIFIGLLVPFLIGDYFVFCSKKRNVIQKASTE